MPSSTTIKRFEELTVHELHDLLRLRVDVFVVEQNCPYPEIDGLDITARHLLLRDKTDALIAYARILPPEHNGLPHIGRVIVHKDHRGKGVAQRLMDHALSVVYEIYGSRRSALASQAHLERFYARSGFERIGPDYILDGIPHVDMQRNAD